MRLQSAKIWPVWFGTAATIAAVLAFPAGGLASELLPAELHGKFRGNLTASNGTSSGDFSVTIEAREDRFTVRWAPRISVTFESAGRPGVFRPTEKTNPLSGVPTYWARLEEARLIVYELQIDEQGDYYIGSYAYTSAAGGLELVVHRIHSGAEPTVFRGRLVRYGG